MLFVSMHHLSAFVSFLVISVDFTRLTSTKANTSFAQHFRHCAAHDSDKQRVHTPCRDHSKSVHADGSKMWGILLGNTVVTLRESQTVFVVSSCYIFHGYLQTPSKRFAVRCIALRHNGVTVGERLANSLHPLQLLPESDSRTVLSSLS